MTQSMAKLNSDADTTHPWWTPDPTTKLVLLELMDDGYSMGEDAIASYVDAVKSLIEVSEVDV